MKLFPYEFAAKRESLFHPEKPESFEGDVLEIGPGRGDFLLAEAEAHPATRFIAIEIKKRRYWKLVKRIEKRGLNNILLIQGDARIVLPKYFRDGTFEQAYVLFPDPWPKRRHVGMRLLSREFLSLLARLLRDGGELILATDALDYLDWIVENAQAVHSLAKTELGAAVSAPASAWIPTFYEQKWRDEGRTIRFVGYRRVISGNPG